MRASGSAGVGWAGGLGCAPCGYPGGTRQWARSARPRSAGGPCGSRRRSPRCRRPSPRARRRPGSPERAPRRAPAGGHPDARADVVFWWGSERWGARRMRRRPGAALPGPGRTDAAAAAAPPAESSAAGTGLRISTAAPLQRARQATEERTIPLSSICPRAGGEAGAAQVTGAPGAADSQRGQRDGGWGTVLASGGRGNSGGGACLLQRLAAVEQVLVEPPVEPAKGSSVLCEAKSNPGTRCFDTTVIAARMDNCHA